MNTPTTVYEEKPAKLLIVDDDPVILNQLGLALSEEFDVRTANDPDQAWDAVRRDKPELVTLDLALAEDDPETGFSLLERCLEYDPLMKVVMITGNGAQENALRAVDQGAFDYFSKPVDLDELRHLLRRAQHVARLERQNARLMSRIGNERRQGDLLGQSPEMKAVFEVIQRVAPTDVSVLVLGESGTGKELVARELRRLSKRASKPFVSISCGAIPENLLESELFGHEKGSFTSAHTSRPGKLELANGGTVLLDEIGDLPLQLQVKLLRFLQEREVERVGGRTVVPLDVRVIAATNRNLADDVARGRFREDLYYRLSVVNIKLPPLRERQEDILYLAHYFLERFSAELGRGRMSFNRAAKEALQRHKWPGNVRELEHHLQRAVLLSNGKVLRTDDLELEPGSQTEPLSLRAIRERTDRVTIIEALRRTCGNISKAAQELEISRPSLHDLLRKHRINANEYKALRTLDAAKESTR
jgi:two-component system NtrC family response regulator